ncbi:TetR/AcrR family transcriptional regulator [Exilibacterium tricleocarpae]|nr:TetR family transcriptional regulator [Exilibacterium tricleocarpae]
MTTTASPFNREQQHQQKRQAILSEAAKLFNRQGTRATTLAEIAARLQLTKTSLYYYVKTKEELIYLCYLNSCNEQDKLYRLAAAAGISGRQRIEQLTRAYFCSCQNIALKRQAEAAVLTEIKTLKDKHRKDISRRYRALYRGVRGFIEQGVADGSLVSRDPAATALAFFFNLQWTFTWLQMLKAEEIPAAGESFLDICLHGFATEPREPPRQTPALGSPAIEAGFDRSVQSQRKQAAFFRTGSRYFNSKGFKGTSLDEIARALDVTKGAFYYHIQSKEDLLYQCFKRTLDLTAQMQARARRSGDGLTQLQLCLHYLFCIQSSAEGPLVRYNLVNALDARRRKKVIELIRGVDRQFRQFVQTGIDDGSIRPLNTLVAEQMISGTLNASADLDERLPTAAPGRLSADFYQMLFDGISAQ